MKRKASVLEESPTVADWSPLDYSSSTSTASPESVKALTHHEHTNAYWNIGTIPYLNSRTYKRYRDGRPDEETIHQKTLAKLFSAQKQIHVEGQREDWQASTNSVPPTACYASYNQVDGSITNHGMPPALLGQPERNQRSIDSFFGRASRAPVPARITIPPFFHFSTMHDTAPTASRCEDCNAALQPTNVNAFVPNADAMFMDQNVQQDEWACASCSRRVCDVCAVRGDHRICLECAIPGGG